MDILKAVAEALPQPATTPQSVTAPPVHILPPKWSSFSPPPTRLWSNRQELRRRLLSGWLRMVLTRRRGLCFGHHHCPAR
jgi:hypothetical protein